MIRPLLLGLLLCLPLWAKAADGARPALVAMGVLGAALMADAPVSRNWSEPGDRDPALRLANAWGRELGMAVTGGLWLGGRLSGREEWVADGEAMALAGALGVSGAWVVKGLSGRLRPDAFARGEEDPWRWFSGGDAFPSGHTTLAFALSTAWAERRPRPGWQRAIAYALAGGTALARVRYRRHWLSDTVAGAWWGWASARWVLARKRAGRWWLGARGVGWSRTW